MRAAFERWYKAACGYDPAPYRVPAYEEGDEEYNLPHVQGAWEAWQHLWPKRATAKSGTERRR